MSWFSSSSSIDDKVEQATSESLPSGAQDLGLNLEICDIIRSKAVPPKEAMRSLKRRLLHKNPNVQLATLNLTDICIKNGGAHFLNEIASREFMDSFVLVLKPLGDKSVDPAVKELMLRYLQNWAKAFEGQIQLAYVGQVYKDLKNDPSMEFPAYDSSQMSASFIDSAAPPEWVDSDTCMISGTPFSFTNRKHHCRNCGGVYIQQYCNNYIALPHYGINTPVRVCDRCYEKLHHQKPPHGDGSSSRGIPVVSSASSSAAANEEEEDDLQKAIRLSLEESKKQTAITAPVPSKAAAPVPEDDEDEQMRLAIEASLNDMQPPNSQRPAQPASRSSALVNGLYQMPAVGQAQPYSTNPQVYSSPASSQQHMPYISSQRSGGPPVQPIELDSLSSLEEEAINKYVQVVDDTERAPPGSILQNTQLQQLHETVGSIRPKLVRNIRTTIDKCEALEEMHGKLTAVIRLYDKILDERLAASYRQPTNAPNGNQSRYTPSNVSTGYPSAEQAQQQGTGTYQYPPDQNSNSPLMYYNPPSNPGYAPPTPASGAPPSDPHYTSGEYGFYSGAPDQGQQSPAPLSVQPQRVSTTQLEPKEDAVLIEL